MTKISGFKWISLGRGKWNIEIFANVNGTNNILIKKPYIYLQNSESDKGHEKSSNDTLFHYIHYLNLE